MESGIYSVDPASLLKGDMSGETPWLPQPALSMKATFINTHPISLPTFPLTCLHLSITSPPPSSIFILGFHAFVAIAWLRN